MRVIGRRRAAAAVLAAVLAVSSGCAFGPPDPEVAGAPPNLPAPSTPESSEPAGATGQEVAVTVLAGGFDVPWGMAFLPDGSALVTERDTARILKVGPETDADGLKVTEVKRLTGVTPGADAGLLGIAVSPQYRTDATVFVYYTTATDNRVASLKLDGTPKPILTGIPRSAGQNGGQLAFGPDGFLYVTTGDGTGKTAQNAKSTGGKILRITRDGKPAPGNPVKNSPVWSSGHRNVQGIAWDSTKRMYATESGQKTTGELNVIEPGKNYGWPAADGTSTDKKYTNPLVSWPVADSDCAGLATVDTLVATACLRGQRLWLIGTTENGTVIGQPQDLLKGEYGRLRALTTAPDGSLWASTSNQEPGGKPAPDDDRIIRLVFSDGGAGRT